MIQKEKIGKITKYNSIFVTFLINKILKENFTPFAYVNKFGI